MEKELVSYELAKQLKENNFDEQCFGYYENQNKLLVINYNNTPLTEEQQKRPGLYKIDNRNSVLPQWATSAPLYQQVTEWLRNEHKINTFVGFRPNIKKWGAHSYNMSLSGTEYVKERSFEKFRNEKKFDNFYEALEFGIKEALELIEKIKPKNK